MIANFLCDIKIDLGGGERPSEYQWATLLTDVPVFASIKPSIIITNKTSRQTSLLTVILDVRYGLLVGGTNYDDLPLLVVLKTPVNSGPESFWTVYVAASNDNNIRLEGTSFSGDTDDA